MPHHIYFIHPVWSPYRPPVINLHPGHFRITWRRKNNRDHWTAFHNARRNCLLNLRYSDHLKVIGALVRWAAGARWPKGRFMPQISRTEKISALFILPFHCLRLCLLLLDTGGYMYHIRSILPIFIILLCLLGLIKSRRCTDALTHS